MSGRVLFPPGRQNSAALKRSLEKVQPLQRQRTARSLITLTSALLARVGMP